MKTFLQIFILSIVLINTGEAQMEDTIEVGTGWNMVGSISDGIAAEMIRSEPAGIIVSPFYGYNPGGGYQSKDTLIRGTGYWVKVNADGILLYGTSGLICGDPLDYEGKTYHTVQIGSQCWLKENLNVGIMIQGGETASNNGIIEKNCYGDDPTYCTTHGGLYAWNEALGYVMAEGGRGICPAGWHIPTSIEYQNLSDFVGGSSNALKALGQGSGSGAGTNTSGFSALLAGYREINGYFLSFSYSAIIWTSTNTGADPGNANILLLDYNSNIINFGEVNQNASCNIRCIKN